MCFGGWFGICVVVEGFGEVLEEKGLGGGSVNMVSRVLNRCHVTLYYNGIVGLKPWF